MSSTLTFTQALLEALTQARRALAPEVHARLTEAVALVKDGRVFQTTEGSWQVDSASQEGLTYTVNGSCSCDDVHYNHPPQGLCKHRISVYLARRVFELMQAPAPAVVPQSPPVETERVPQPLPEAPCSVNVHVTIGGRQVQITLRGQEEAEVLTRLEALLARYPLAPPAPSQPPAPRPGQGEEKGWCAVHNVAMKLQQKGERTWYSHRTDDGFCKGR